MKPFMIPGHRSNTPLVLVFLSVTGCWADVIKKSQIPIAAAEGRPACDGSSAADDRRYTALFRRPFFLILRWTSFRSSGYVTNVGQVRGADGRTRNVGTGDYVRKASPLRKFAEKTCRIK